VGERPRPASWLVVERGWAVVDAGGDELGTVDEVIGDAGADIFDGLAVSTGTFQQARYVPAASISRIDEGRVQLELPAADFEALDAYTGAPPGTSGG
jgi:uncharacterized protein YrrD